MELVRITLGNPDQDATTIRKEADKSNAFLTISSLACLLQQLAVNDLQGWHSEPTQEFWDSEVIKEGNGARSSHYRYYLRDSISGLLSLEEAIDQANKMQSR